MSLPIAPPLSPANSWPEFRTVINADGRLVADTGRTPTVTATATGSGIQNKDNGTAAYTLSRLLGQSAALASGQGGKLAGSLPGGSATSAAILRFVVAAHSRDIGSAFPRGLWSTTVKALPVNLQQRLQIAADLWLRQNPLDVRDSNYTLWRMFHIPWWQDQQPNVMRLFYQLERRKDDQQRKRHVRNKEIKRFVIELVYSGLGHVQLEGMVDEDSSRIRITVRSENAISKYLQDTIRTMCLKLISVEDWAATIAFHVLPGYRPPVAGVSGETDRLV